MGSMKSINTNKAFTLLEVAIGIIAIALIIGALQISKKLISNTENLVALNQQDNAWDTSSSEEGGEEESSGLPYTSGLVLWLDASDADTITEADSTVTVWADKSSSGNDALAPASVSNRPTYGTVDAETFPGLNVVNFESTEYMLLTNAINLTDSTVFVVAEQNGSNGRVLAAATANIHYVRYRNSKVVIQDDGFNGYTYDITTYDEKIVVVANDATNSTRELFVDGSSISSAVTYSGNITPDAMGYHNGQAQGEFYAAEILIYDRLLTSSEIDQMETYLSDKWNVTLDGL